MSTLNHLGMLLTEAEAAEAIGVSTRTLRRLRRRGLPAYRLGRGVRYDLEEVRIWAREESAREAKDRRAEIARRARRGRALALRAREAAAARTLAEKPSSRKRDRS